jgi:hypothetical protein
LDRLLIFGALLRAGGLTDFTGPSWGKNRAGARGRYTAMAITATGPMATGATASAASW